MTERDSMLGGVLRALDELSATIQRELADVSSRIRTAEAEIQRIYREDPARDDDGDDELAACG